MSTELAIRGEVLPPVGELSRLAVEINGFHDAAIGSVRTALVSAQACGEKLIEAKALLPHGAWLPWLEANTRLSRKTAAQWMRLAKATPRQIEGAGGVEAATVALARVRPNVTRKLHLTPAPAHHLLHVLPGATEAGELHELVVQWYYDACSIRERMAAGTRPAVPSDEDRLQLLAALDDMEQTIKQIRRTIV